MPALVSIVIPCYKGAAYLAEAIESCLRQTHTEIELIIVNDASPDECAQIAESYAAKDSRVRLVNLESNRGVSGAFNAGFAVAKGGFMTRLAQDDLFREDAISLMLNRLSLNPEAGLVYCDEQIIDESGKFVSYKKNAEGSPDLMNGNQVGMCFMWTRKVWQEIGEFDRRYDAAEDYDFWRRVMERFKMVYCPDAPFFNRDHPATGTRTFAIKQQLAVALIRARYIREACARRNFLSRAYLDAAYDLCARKSWLAASQCILRAIAQDPFWYKPYTYALRLAFEFTSNQLRVRS